MARSRAEDQRGFVASEQGGSQSSAGRGRRDCNRLQTENRHQGAGQGERRGGQAGRRGSAAAPEATRLTGALSVRKERGAAEFPSQAQSPQRKVTWPWGRAPGRREEDTHLDVQPGCPCQQPVPAPPPGPSPQPFPCLGAGWRQESDTSSLPAAPPRASPLPGAPQMRPPPSPDPCQPR